MDCHAGLQNAENARSLAYRDDPAFIPELDFVMELDGRLIGHVRNRRSYAFKASSYRSIVFQRSKR